MSTNGDAKKLSGQEVWAWLKGHFWQLTALLAVTMSIWSFAGKELIKARVDDLTQEYLESQQAKITKVLVSALVAEKSMVAALSTANQAMTVSNDAQKAVVVVREDIANLAEQARILAGTLTEYEQHAQKELPQLINQIENAQSVLGEYQRFSERVKGIESSNADCATRLAALESLGVTVRFHRLTNLNADGKRVEDVTTHGGDGFYEQKREIMHQSEGVCVLSGVWGNFTNRYSTASVHVNKNGKWVMRVGGPVGIEVLEVRWPENWNSGRKENWKAAYTDDGIIAVGLMNELRRKAP